jgi:N-acetylglucosaminyldiphosphoundecaprenol N-acetyl-beta-D-mannosaminyltransferase
MSELHCLPQSGASAARIEFIDMAFTADDDAQVLDAIRGRDPAAPFAYIVTPNVDHIVRLQRSRSDLWPAYRAAWMTLCDSRILARLASLSGLPLPVLPGSDLTVRMMERVIDRDDRIAIIGGGTERVAALADRYGLRSVAHHEPPMGFIDDPAAIERVARFAIDARARYHFFAVGSPQQEMLAYRIARMGGATGIGLCVGASLDFLTGVQTRAPASMQRLSIEWLYRLGSDPRRLWRRYLVDGPEIFGIARDWRRTHPAAAHRP